MRSLIAAAVLLLLLAQPAFAGIGLSPAEISFKGMIRGGYSEKYFTVSNPTDDLADVNIAITGSVGSWTIIEPQQFTLQGRSFGVFKVIVQPPADTPNGVYNGQIMVVGRPHVSSEGGASSVSVASAVAAGLTVEVSDVQTLRLNVEAASISDTEECRSIIAEFRLRNLGNVRITPHITFDIKNSEGVTVQKHEQNTEEVLPTRATYSMIMLPYQLTKSTCIPEGQYTVDAVIYSDTTVMGRATLGFHVWPRGHLTISGEIIEIQAPTNVTLGETARIDAVFKNTGQLPVSAKLVAEILSGAAIVDTISGDPKEVGIGGIDKLTAYWRPSSPGRYIIRAKATFEDHETATKEATIEANPPGWWMIAGGAAAGMLIVIVVIFTRLRKGKKGKKGRKR